MVSIESIAKDVREAAETEPLGLCFVMREIERELLLSLMQDHKGHVTKATHAINIKRTTMSMKLASHQIISANFKP